MKITDLLGELWLPIDGYEDHYEVSNMGRIKSLARHIEAKDGKMMFFNERILKISYSTHIKQKHVITTIDKGQGGLVMLCLSGKKTCCTVGALVLTAFTGPRPTSEHRARTIENPCDFRLDNLIWCK